MRSSQELLQQLAASANACACFNLRKATRAVTQLFDDALRPLGLRSTQFSVLVALREVGPVMMSDLAGTLGTDRTTLTRNLQLLEQDGMIRIHPGADRRKREIGLTAGGRRQLERAIPIWEATQERIRDGLGRRRFDRFLADLAAVSAVARRNTGEEGGNPEKPR